MRNMVKGIGVALAASLLTLCALELVTRVVGVSVGTLYINRKTVEASDDPALRFQLRAGAVAAAEVEYRINDHRMRNRPVVEFKPPEARRVAVLGDSITFGYWVAVDDAFPAQLERLLRESDHGDQAIEVLNFGVPGYNIDQELAWLERQVLRFSPDLVILALCLNDFESVFSYEYGLVVRRREVAESGGMLRRSWDLLLDHSVLLSWVEYRLIEFEVRRQYAAAGPHNSPITDEARMAARRDLDGRLQRFSELLRHSGEIRGVVAIFPTFDKPWSEYANGWLHETILESGRAHGLEVVDLRTCLSGYAPESVRVDPIHPNPLGHRIAAHAIAEVVAGVDLGDCRGYRTQDFPAVRGY